MKISYSSHYYASYEIRHPLPFFLVHELAEGQEKGKGAGGMGQGQIPYLFLEFYAF
jgi:hypothetical protein